MTEHPLVVNVNYILGSTTGNKIYIAECVPLPKEEGVRRKTKITYYIAKYSSLELILKLIEYINYNDHRQEIEEIIASYFEKTESVEE